jgi:Protein of unknown function (DUF1573)
MALDEAQPPRRTSCNREMITSLNLMNKGKYAMIWMTGFALIGSGCSEEPRISEPKGVTKPVTTKVVIPSPPSVLRVGNIEFSPAVQYQKAAVGTAEVEFVFMATNLGSIPVTITKIDSGCACIKESVDPKIIPPGGAARISAVYTTDKISGTAEKIITISTDQPRVRDVFLTVKLEMDPIYHIDNELSTWARGSPPTPKTVTFEVVRNTPIHLLEVKSSRTEITAEVEVVEKGRKYLIHIKPSSTASNLLGMVRLITDCEIEAHARPLLYVTVQ